LAAAGFLAGAAWAGGFEVKLTVEEPAGLARQAHPASGGIPLPAGAFKKDQAFSVYAGGAELPSQVLPLVVDEKGCLRWVLVDTQVDLGAKEKKDLVLKAAAPGAKPAAAVKVTDDASGVTVDTGKVKFTVPRDKPFSLFSSVEAGGKPVAGGGEASYTDITTGPEGKRYVADKPSAVAVEYSGPMRATVCVRGRFVGDDQNKLTYVARITAWAGRSDVHVKYSLANSNEANYTWRRIKESAVRLKLAGEPSASLVGAGKPAEAGAEAWMAQSARAVKAAVHGNDSLEENPCYHRTPGAAGPGGAKAMAGDKELWVSSGKGDLSQGWLLARLGGGAVAVHDLYFVEDPPRKLALAKGHLELYGVTELLDPAHAPFNEANRWLFDCSHLSSQYLLDFAPPADAAGLGVQARAARGKLHLMAPPAWYFETEALPVGKYATQADEMACYDKWGWKYDKGRAPTQPDGQTRGIPRWTCGDDNHYTSEQDTLDCLLLMYLRTGARNFYDSAETWANYFMDLQSWRTDGWRWKDGGTWWTNRGSPIGNAPQRKADPVVGMHNRLILAGGDKKPGTYSVKDVNVELKVELSKAAFQDIHFLARAKACHCHNWGEGISSWFLVTGDRDALETGLDCAEQNYDTQRRGFKKEPGKPAGFSRDFTRACYLVNAARLCAPDDKFLVEASDYLARVYLERPDKEPRGFLNAPAKIDMKTIEEKVGAKGLAKMKELGVTFDAASGQLADPKTGAKWMPLNHPQTWMYPPLSRAMDLYLHLTGSEDAHDWLIAYGQGVGRVLFQEKHGNLNYSHFLVDFPTKGWAWDRDSWELPDDATSGKGLPIKGYLAEFHPDVIARGYLLSGDPLLKQRALDMWYGATHPGADMAEGKRANTVGRWVNCYSTHDETVCYTGKTFYIWSHPRADEKPPKAVSDLKVTIAEGKATVSFTAPADEGGGKVARYQVKCSDKPIVDYVKFLELWKQNQDAASTNWWMAANLKDEPAPQAPGAKESFAVSGVPAGAKFFTVVAYDDSANCSALSNVAEVGK